MVVCAGLLSGSDLNEYEYTNEYHKECYLDWDWKNMHDLDWSFVITESLDTPHQFQSDFSMRDEALAVVEWDVANPEQPPVEVHPECGPRGSRWLGRSVVEVFPSSAGVLGLRSFGP